MTLARMFDLTRSLRSSAVVGTCGALFLLGACSAEDLAESAVERAIESEIEGDASVDLDGDGGIVIETDEGTVSIEATGDGDSAGVVISGDDGETVFESSTGGDDDALRAVDTWPTELLPPEGSEILASQSVTSGGARLDVVTHHHPLPPAELLEVYRSMLGAWTIDDETVGDGFATISASSDGPDGPRVLTLSILTFEDGSSVQAGVETTLDG